MDALSVAERRAIGKQARRQAPRSSAGDWTPAPDRRDPVALLEEQNADRVDWLVPVRHARMAVSAFTFYRGTARIMAADLAGTPNSGLTVQLGGDAHLSNFGAYASPERTLVVDANDFDETLPGPWEWDVQRLAASFYIAGQDHGEPTDSCRDLARLCVEHYRTAMAGFAKLGYLDLWYRISDVGHIARLVDTDAELALRSMAKFERKARARTSTQALRKLAYFRDGRFRWRTEHPVLVPVADMLPQHEPEVIRAGVERSLAAYRETLRSDRQMLLDRYRLVDIALKVVGVGSVGTRCYVLLLQGRDQNDPLFLQAKEAGPSVLEEFLPASVYTNHGHRVVAGQRRIQSQSDILLGWTVGAFGRDFYVRQLRDWKASFDVASAGVRQLRNYARVCGHILARGHARSGDPTAIAAYLGSSTKFEDAMAEFAHRYAAQTNEDYQRFQSAIASGRLAVAPEPYR